MFSRSTGVRASRAPVQRCTNSSDVRIFFKWALEQSPEPITVHDVYWFIEWQQSLGRAPATVRRRLISLRMFYDYLVYIREEQVTNPVIVKRHYVEKGHRLPRNIRKKEIEKTFTAIGDHLGIARSSR